MSPPRKPRRWPRRTAYMLGGGLGLLLLAAVVLWWSLPALVRSGFARGATAVGFEEASIQVDRADLTGLHATAMLLRMGGLEMRMENGAASYTVRELIGGRVARLAVDGLAVTLDFTQPRRGLLPDAVGDLQAQFGGDDPLVWPVDELAFQNCRVVLVLPGGPQTFTVAGSATRQPDGRIAFAFRSEHTEQELQISGTVRTETMDGELTLHRLSLQPALLLGLAHQLGLFDLPPGTTFTSERVELTGAATLRGGGPETYSGEVRAPFVRAAVDGTNVAMDEFTAKIARGAGGALSGELRATLKALNNDVGWNVGPAQLHLALEGGRVRGGADDVAFAYADTANGNVTVNLDSGVPQLGGTPQAKVQTVVRDLSAGDFTFAPLELQAEGWIERATLNVPRVALAEGGPAAVMDLTVTIVTPLETNRSLEGSATILAHDVLRQFLPEGWSLAEPGLPAPVARIDFRGTGSDGGPAATLVLRSTLPRVRLTAGEMSVGGAPAFEATITSDARGAGVAASLDVEALDLHLPVDIPAVNAVSAGFEVAPMSYATWTALVERRVPDEDLRVTVQAALAKSTATGSASLMVRREAQAREWQVVASVSAGGINGQVGPAQVTDVSGNVHVDSGLVPDDRVRTWMQIEAPRELVETVLAQCDARVSVTAAAVEQPGVARAEWAGAWLIKPPATADGALLAGSLTINAGVLRSGPEVIEQPTLKLAFAGDYGAQDLTVTCDALLEGVPLKFEATQHIGFDIDAQTGRGEGTFVLQPFTLTNSDIVSRWVPSLSGVAISGTVEARGKLQAASDGVWDGSTAIKLSHGVVNYPAQKVSGEGFFADVTIESLAQLRTPPGQRVGLTRLAIGDIIVSDIAVRFRTASSSVVHVEGVETHVFGGTLNAEAFSLYFPDPDVALDLSMSNLDADELVRTFELFTGTLTGRLRGRLPIGLLAGRPIIGEGFLELEENVPATLSFNTGGLFTVGLPDRTMIDQLNRLPYELLEDGLRGLELKHFRVDLFRRDRPDVPIEMQLGGTAHTSRADVPIELTVRVNGSIAEVVQHVLQFVLM